MECEERDCGGRWGYARGLRIEKTLQRGHGGNKPNPLSTAVWPTLCWWHRARISGTTALYLLARLGPPRTLVALGSTLSPPRWQPSKDRGLRASPHLPSLWWWPRVHVASWPWRLAPGLWVPGWGGEIRLHPIALLCWGRPQHASRSPWAQNFLFLSLEPTLPAVKASGCLPGFFPGPALLRPLPKAGPPRPQRSGKEPLISLERERWLCWTVCGQCWTQQTTRASLRGTPPHLRRAQKKARMKLLESPPRT